VSPAIELTNVTKRYGNTVAVNGLSLCVPARSVYGFLGPNGAGKTTSIRLMLGLQRPDVGNIRLFGEPLETRRLALLRRTGALVESPSLYPPLTGYENLKIHQQLRRLPQTSIADALEIVNLSSAASRVVRTYSSGMRQRLGIALALIGKPELLVLDEPTNALDPAGIHEIRNLVRDLPSRSGATVFLSSHMLAEVEQVATHVAILSQGTLVFEGTRDQLRQRTEPALVIRVDRIDRAMRILNAAGFAAGSRDNYVRVRGVLNPGDVNRMLVEAGITVSHLAFERTSLEDEFLALTRPAEVC